MDTVETVEYRGFTIEILQDEHYESPADRQEDDLFLVFYHRDCWIPSKEFTENDGAEWVEKGCPARWREYWIFPVEAYIHGGVCLKLGRGGFPGDAARWDTSFAGAVLARRAEFKERKQAERVAEALVKQWNMYLAGEVYGYEIEGVEDGSCWGFYGDWQDEDESGLLQEARQAIDWHIQQQRAEHCKKLKGWIRAGVPLQYRKQF